MLHLRFQYCFLATLFILISQSVAAPASEDVDRCQHLLRPQKAFCTKWLNGATPTATLVTAKATGTVTATVTQTITHPTTTVTVGNTATAETVVTVTQAPKTVTVIVSTSTEVTTTSTGLPKILPRGVSHKKHRKPKKPKNVSRYSDDAITQACLKVIYGTNHYPPTTITEKSSSTSTCYVTQDGTSTVTQTGDHTNTITQTFTPTNQPAPITVTSTEISTKTITKVVAPTAQIGVGGSCTLVGLTFTCTFSSNAGAGLTSTFAAPCNGLMSVKLRGANGGATSQNSNTCSGHGTSSNILFNKGNIIPASTPYDIILGGNGQSAAAGGLGGSNGGGSGVSGGAGGGGCTEIQQGGQRLAIAGGGGGNGILTTLVGGLNLGLGDANPDKVYTSSLSGAAGVLLGTGGGGGGLQGGAAGSVIGYGGISGKDLGTSMDPTSLGNAAVAIVTFTCSA